MLDEGTRGLHLRDPYHHPETLTRWPYQLGRTFPLTESGEGGAFVNDITDRYACGMAGIVEAHLQLHERGYKRYRGNNMRMRRVGGWHLGAQRVLRIQFQGQTPQTFTFKPASTSSGAGGAPAIGSLFANIASYTSTDATASRVA